MCSGKMFKLIFKYTFTGLFVSHFVMLCMLITKFAYEVRPLPLAAWTCWDPSRVKGSALVLQCRELSVTGLCGACVWCLWQDLPFFLPLPVLTYFAMDVMSKWFGRLESHVPLYMAVTKDMKYWTVSPRPPTLKCHRPAHAWVCLVCLCVSAPWTCACDSEWRVVGPGA